MITMMITMMITLMMTMIMIGSSDYAPATVWLDPGKNIGCQSVCCNLMEIAPKKKPKNDKSIQKHILFPHYSVSFSTF